MDVPTDRSRVSRRLLLAGAGGALTGSAGCLRRLGNLSERPDREQLTVTITALPIDSDPFALEIAAELAAGLEAVGIDYRLSPTDAETLYQEVLLGHNFDIYVGQLPYGRRPNPDTLYPLFHSRFSVELGWQNPFGFTDLDCDDLLETQRTTEGDSRRAAITDLQTLLGRTQPFVPLVLPEETTGVRTTRFRGWETAVDRLPHGLLKLVSATAEETRLRVASTDSRITTNRNPISATHHTGRSLVQLLYDPLVLVDDGERLPWLASDLSWDDEPLQVDIELREGLQWHDGEPLTAADVAFTYRFLADTSLGSASEPIPAPQFRGESTLVSTVDTDDERHLSIRFEETTQPVARQALTVPILPAHVWETYTNTVSVAGIEIDGSTTEALVSNNQEPVGSGPLQFSEAEDGTEAVFERFEDHFLTTTDDDRLSAFHGGPPFDELLVQSAASHGTAVELLVNDGTDAALSPISPDSVDQIREADSVTAYPRRSHAIYHLGFNTRRTHLSNPNLRQLIARLVDKATLAETVFGGFGQPVASPLAETDWLAAELEWSDDTDPAVPFFGTDGELDAEAAREAFREAGFRYNEDGELMVSS